MEPLRKNWTIIVFLLGLVVVAVQANSSIAQNTKDIEGLKQTDQVRSSQITSINTQLLVFMADISARLRNLERVNGIQSAPVPAGLDINAK